MCRWTEILDICIGMQMCHSGLLGVWKVLIQDEWRMQKRWDGRNMKTLQAAIGNSVCFKLLEEFGSS